jgi:hypothetical protein
MRRPFKIKALAASMPLRRAPLSSVPAARLVFPAWIVADEGGVTFSARGAVTLRVRDSLVLRKVSRRDRSASSRSSNAHRV